MIGRTNKTVLTIMLLAPAYGFLSFVGIVVPPREYQYLLSSISRFEFLIAYPVLLAVSALICILFIRVGRKFNRLPFWAAFIPMFIGVLGSIFLFLFFFANKTTISLDDIDEVVLLPFILLSTMGLLSWFSVFSFWKVKQ